MELMLIARRATSNLQGRGARVERVFCGSFMTSLDMAGASVTVMRVDALSLARLDAAADTPGWREAHGTRSKRPPHQLIPYSSSSGGGASTAASPAGGGSEAAAQEEEGGGVSPGEWGAVEGAVRAAANALVAAEPASENPRKCNCNCWLGRLRARVCVLCFCAVVISAERGWVGGWLRDC
ncbi:unnamed protein product [Ectocarpus sp. 8 AP-2014]